jgi:hypothetical protein
MKPQCRNGHPYTPENSKVNTQGNRICVACLAARNAQRGSQFKGRTGHIVRKSKADEERARI